MTKLSNKSIWIWGVVALAALVPYLNALQCGFAFDDEGLIQKNSLVSANSDWQVSVTTPYWPPPNDAGLYRPVVTGSYRLQNGLGNGPFGFHLLNILIHLAVCLTLLGLLRKLFPGRETVSLLATLVFAVHPLHTEAVTGIVGRAELLSALFGMIAYRVWLGRPRWFGWLAACLCFALAMASKEGAVGWLLLIGAHRLGLLGDDRSYRTSGAAGDAPKAKLVADTSFITGFLLYVLVRYKVLGAIFGLSRVDYVDNPLFEAAVDSRIVTALWVMAKGVALVIWPASLSADYSAFAIPVIGSWLHPAALVLPALVAAIYFAIRNSRRFPLLAWGLALYLATLLPVSNLLVPIGTILGERLLYLPSLGLILCLLVAGEHLLRRCFSPSHGRVMAIVLSMVVIAGLGGRTWRRNPDWNNTETLFASVVATEPQSVKGLANLGSELSKRGELKRAEALYDRAIKLMANYPAGLIGKGYICIMEQRYAEAEALLSRARELNPESTKALLRLGNLYLEIERAEEGLDCFDQLLVLNPYSSDGWIGKASAHFMLGQYGESAAAWEAAHTHRDGKSDYRRYLFAARHKAGMFEEAVETLESLLADQPENAAYHHEMATLILQHLPVRISRGEQAAQRAVDLSPTTEYIGTVLSYFISNRDCAGAFRYLESKMPVIQSTTKRDSLSRFIMDQCR
jgi:protein O-mannosyl-transferase